MDTTIVPFDIIKTFQKCSVNNAKKIMKMCRFEIAYGKFLKGEDVNFNYIDDPDIDDSVQMDLISKLIGKDLND